MNTPLPKPISPDDPWGDALPDKWADGERTDAPLFTISSLGREQLRQRQQRIEGEMEALETCTEQEFGKSAGEMQARMRALSLEWEAIEDEWACRAGAMADPVLGVGARVQWRADGVARWETYDVATGESLVQDFQDEDAAWQYLRGMA